MYISMDHKVEKRREITNSGCRRSREMLRVIVVRYPVHERADLVAEVDEVGHGTPILKHVMASWGSSRIVV